MGKKYEHDGGVDPVTLPPEQLNQTTLKIKTTSLGDMLYLPQDLYVGRLLDLYGEYAYHEIEFFKYIAQWGGAAIDCGANMGCHTVALAKLFEHVFAFEPQMLMFRILRANTAEYLNTTLYRAFVGAREGVDKLPLLNYELTNNYGGMGKYLEFDKEHPTETIQVRMIDKVEAIRKADKIGLIKIDVEGMEAEAIEGAMAMIDKHRPVLYVENDKPSRASALVNLIYNLGYTAWWHNTPLYREDNFYGNKENVIPNIFSFNLICLPDKHPAQVIGYPQCTPDNPHLPEGCVTSYK